MGGPGRPAALKLPPGMAVRSLKDNQRVVAKEKQTAAQLQEERKAIKQVLGLVVCTCG